MGGIFYSPPHRILLYSTAQHSTIQYREYSTVQYSTVQYSTVQYLHCACFQSWRGRLVFIIYVILWYIETNPSKPQRKYTWALKKCHLFVKTANVVRKKRLRERFNNSPLIASLFE
jgi:hypothetical protein